MLELVEVKLTGVDGRILGSVILEINDIDVQVLLFGLLLEFHPLRIGGAHHTDLHRVGLGSLFCGLVGSVERTNSKERSDRDQCDHHDGDDDVTYRVIDADRFFRQSCRLLICFCHDESSLSFLIALHGFQRVCDGLHAIASCPTIRDASAARRRNLKIALSEFVIAGVQSQ